MFVLQEFNLVTLEYYLKITKITNPMFMIFQRSKCTMPRLHPRQLFKTVR
jgi:hypothetical protein